MLVSLIFWVTTGRKKFTGPEDGNLLQVSKEVAQSTA
jgi:choline transport protein